MKEKIRKNLAIIVDTIANFDSSLFPLIREIRQGVNLGMPYNKLEKTIKLFHKREQIFYNKVEQYKDEVLDLFNKEKNIPEKIQGDIEVYFGVVELNFYNISELVIRIKEGFPYEEYNKAMKIIYKNMSKLRKDGERLIDRIK